MKICYETVRNSEEIRTYITQADQSLLARGFTEHSFAHVTRCAEFAARILAQLGYGEHDQELARSADPGGPDRCAPQPGAQQGASELRHP